MVANTPFIGTKKLKKQAELLNMVQKKVQGALDILVFFITGYWEFENSNIKKCIESMSEHEREIF